MSYAQLKLSEFRKLSSEDARKWVESFCPPDSEDLGPAFEIIGKRSWKKQDQIKLARCYFTKRPFAASKPYEQFLNMMSIDSFFKVMQEKVPDDLERRKLLYYQLETALKRLEIGADDVNKLINQLGKSKL